MKPKPKNNIKKKIANTFGSLGYIFCCFQWFWAIMLYFSVIQPALLFVSSANEKQAEQPSIASFTLPGPLEAVIVTIVAVCMVLLTIYVLVKLPMSIAKTGNKVVYRASETVTPVVIKVQHKKDTKKVHAKITSRVVIVVKLLLTAIPLAFTVGSGLLEKQSISYEIAVIIGGGLALLGVLFFAAQYLLAGAFRMKLSELW